MRLSAVVEGTHAAGLTVVVGLVVLDPLAGLRAAPDWAGWVCGQQRLDRVMSRVAPVLFLTTAMSTAAAVGVALAQHRSWTAAGRAAAAGCVAGAIGVTLTRNEPVNRELRGWRATDEPTPGWRDARVRWERAHLVRWVLLAVAAGTAAAGPLLDSLTGRQG